jgi:hypothetical protein
MNDHNEPHDDLEMYLDGLLPESKRNAFLSQHDAAKLNQIQATQDQIDASLRSMFEFEPLDSEQVQDLTRKVFQRDSSALNAAKPSPTVNLKANESIASGRRFVLAALAASMLAIIGAGLWWTNRDLPTDPFFENRAMASLYQETVEAGFEPYYHCEDDQRFMDTFKFRLGRAVQLAESEMPEGTRMLGLSYLGGTSRQSTAMLGQVDGHPVIVFVDRSDVGQLDAVTKGTDDLNVFVVERDGLVFAEVSPLNESKMIQYMKVLND